MGLEQQEIRRSRAAVAVFVVAILVASALAVWLVVGAAINGSGSRSLGAGSIATILAAPLSARG